jgi:WD40 repeat protein
VVRILAAVVVGGLMLCIGACGSTTIENNTPPTQTSAAPVLKAGEDGGSKTRAEGPPPMREKPGRGPAVAVDSSSDGKLVVTADAKCNVTLWSRDADKPVWTVRATDEIDPHSRDRWHYGAFAVKFASDEKRVFVAWRAGVAQIDREKGTILKITEFPKSVLTYEQDSGAAVAFLPGSDECVYYGTDERLVRFNFATNKRHDKFDLPLQHTGGVAVTISPDGKRVLGWTSRGLNEWDLATGEVCQRFPSMQSGFNSIRYTPNGEGIWIPQKTYIVLNRRTGEPIDLPEPLANYKGWLWLSPDGKHALGLPRGEREDDRVDILSVEDGKVLRSFSSNSLFYQEIPPPVGRAIQLQPRRGLVVFTPDGKTVVLLSGSGYGTELGFWDVATGKHIRTLRDEWWLQPGKE